MPLARYNEATGGVRPICNGLASSKMEWQPAARGPCFPDGAKLYKSFFEDPARRPAREIHVDFTINKCPDSLAAVYKWTYSLARPDGRVIVFEVLDPICESPQKGTSSPSLSSESADGFRRHALLPTDSYYNAGLAEDGRQRARVK